MIFPGLPWFSLVFLSVAGCQKSPSERTQNAEGGALGSFGLASRLTVYSDELFSGGGAFLYPGGENQSLSFNDQSSPLSARSIRYAWNGRAPELGNTSFIFCGVDLMHTATETEYDGTAGRDLRQAGYTKVTFYARGSLSTNTVLKIEVSDDGSTGTAAPCITLSTSGAEDDAVTPCGTGLKGMLTGSWQKFSVPIASSDQAAIKDLFKATLVFNQPFVGNETPGQGGTVYFDQIFYEP